MTEKQVPIELPTTTWIIPDDVDKIHDRLHTLSESLDKSKPEIQTVIEKSQTVDQDIQAVKKRAIRHYASMDTPTSEKLNRIENLDLFVQQIARGEISLDEIRDLDLNKYDSADQLLFDYLQSKATQTVAHPLTELHQAVVSSNRKALIRTAQRLSQTTSNPEDPLWHALVNEGVITSDYVDNLDLISNFCEMARKWQIIESSQENLNSNERESLRATIFSPYLEKGISPEMVNEIVAGRFELDDKFIQGALQMFIKEQPRAIVKKMSLRQKAARVVIISAMSVIMTTSNADLSKIPPPPPPQEKQAQVEPQKKPEQKPPKKTVPKNYHRENQPGEKGSGETGPGSSSQQTPQSSENPQGNSESVVEEKYQEIPGASEKGETNPLRLISKEDYEKLKKIPIWWLQGSPLAGYFRTNTATNFSLPANDLEAYGWQVDNLPTTNAGEIKTGKDVKMTRVFEQVPPVTDLAVENGFTVNTNSLEVRIDGKKIDLQENLTIRKDINGIYTLVANPGATFPEGMVTITYYLGTDFSKTVAISTPEQTAPIVENMDQILANILDSQFYDDRPPYSQLIKIYNDKSKTPDKKAQEIQNWIKKNTKYSFRTDLSDWYQSSPNPDFLIKRILSLKEVNCYYANTVLLSMTRSLGIPSRMAMGYRNGSPLEYISAAESHAWVEILVNGKWEILDATPPLSSEQKQTQQQKDKNQQQDGGNSQGQGKEQQQQEKENQGKDQGSEENSPEENLTQRPDGEPDSRLPSIEEFYESLRSLKEDVENDPGILDWFLITTFLANIAATYVGIQRFRSREKRVFEKAHKMTDLPHTYLTEWNHEVIDGLLDKLSKRPPPFLEVTDKTEPISKAKAMINPVLTKEAGPVWAKSEEDFGPLSVILKRLFVIPGLVSDWQTNNRVQVLKDTEKRLDGVLKAGPPTDPAFNPVMLNAKLAGFDEKEIITGIQEENKNLMLGRLRGSGLLGNQLAEAFNLDGDLVYRLRMASPWLREYLWGSSEKIFRYLGKSEDLDLDPILDNISKRTYEAYLKEKKRRDDARMIPLNRRNDEEKIYADRQDLPMTEEEFNDTMRNVLIRPFTIAWLIARS